MTLFLLIFLAATFFAVIKTRQNILCKDTFWLGLFWCFILGVYLFSGVSYGDYGISFPLVIFLSFVYLSFQLGRKKAFASKILPPALSNPQKRIKYYIVLGLLGLFLFVGDAIAHNGLLFLLVDVEGKSDVNVSLVGATGVLFVPILFVIGLYQFGEKLITSNKISISGLLLCLLYTIPCMLHNGRESFLYIVVGLISIYGYASIIRSRKTFKLSLGKILTLLSFVIIVIGLFSFMINISRSRYGSNEINVFLYKHNVSSTAIAEGSKWGDFEFLYYNILSYFGHQIPFLDFTIREYHGPYLFGMFELNIISRRLPDFLGLDYNLVYFSFDKLFSTNKEDFSRGWNTVLGSLICDFTVYGAVVVVFFIGFITGKIRRAFIHYKNLNYATITALICASTFATLQLGPFYNILVYGTYIWWYIILGRSK